MAPVPSSCSASAFRVVIASPAPPSPKCSVATYLRGQYAKAAELGLPVAVEHTYIEKHTGEELYERPAYNALLAAAKRAEFRTVICWNVDRVARNSTLQDIFYMELSRAGCDVVFVHGDIDNTPQGRMWRWMRGEGAAMESAWRKQRIMGAKRARAERGLPIMGARCKYGYRWNEDKTGYLIDEDTAPVVCRMFQAIASGVSLRQLAYTLTQELIPTPTGLPIWNPAVVRNMLRDSAYWGVHINFKMRREALNPRERPHYKGRARLVPTAPEEQIVIQIPALVSEELGMAVAARFALNKANATRRLREPEEAILYRLVRCGYCGQIMAANRRPSRVRADGSVTVLYVCRTRINVKGDCPEGTALTSRPLDEAVWAKVRAVLENPALIRREVEAMQDEDTPGESTLQTIEQAIADTNRKIANLTRVAAMTADNEDAAQQIAEDLHKLSEQKRGYQGQLTAAQAHFMAWKAQREGLTSLLAWCETVKRNLDALTYQEKRHILETLQVHVTVWRSSHDPHVEMEMRLPLAGIVSLNDEVGEGISVAHNVM